jgi:hypothetical protein
MQRVCIREEGGVMDKCDKCKNMARVTVHNFTDIRYLCAKHAGELCLSVGDQEGYDKFTALIEGDREYKETA